MTLVHNNQRKCSLEFRKHAPHGELESALVSTLIIYLQGDGLEHEVRVRGGVAVAVLSGKASRVRQIPVVAESNRCRSFLTVDRLSVLP